LLTGFPACADRFLLPSLPLCSGKSDFFGAEDVIFAFDGHSRVAGDLPAPLKPLADFRPFFLASASFESGFFLELVFYRSVLPIALNCGRFLLTEFPLFARV